MSTHDIKKLSPLLTQVIDQGDGTMKVSSLLGSEEAVRPGDELNYIGTADATADRVHIFDVSSGEERRIAVQDINAPEVFRNNGILVGVAPAPYKVGIDYSTGTQYYVNTAGNRQAFPAGTTVVVTDLANGQLNINAGLGGNQNSIRPIGELSLLSGALDDLVDKIPILDSSTGNTVYITPSLFRNDFWRSGVGATTLPDGTTDITENIRRNGKVGINIDPISTLDVNGSFGVNFQAISGNTTYAIGGTETTIEMTGVTASTANVVLPNAGLYTRRIICIKLAQGNNLGVINVTSVGGGIEGPDGATYPTFVLSQGKYRGAIRQSDSGNRQLIGLVPIDGTTYSRFQNILTGGGIVKFTPDRFLSWSERFICLGGGLGVGSPSSVGYYDIVMPPVGTVVRGYANATNVTVTAKGIPMGDRRVLYYEIPIGGSGTVNGNFHIVGFGGTPFAIPNNWIMIATVNSDTEYAIKLGNGDVIHSVANIDNRDAFLSKHGYEVLRQTNTQQLLLSGGGTKSWNAVTGLFSRNNRFITISGGVNNLVPSGYFDIIMPGVGINALVANNTGVRTDRSFTANGILINQREALYYVLPIAGGNGSINTNYRIVPYNQGPKIPDHWILVATRNGDSNILKLGTGEFLGVTVLKIQPFTIAPTIAFTGFTAPTGSQPMVYVSSTQQTITYRWTGPATIPNIVQWKNYTPSSVPGYLFTTETKGMYRTTNMIGYPVAPCMDKEAFDNYAGSGTTYIYNPNLPGGIVTLSNMSIEVTYMLN